MCSKDAWKVFHYATLVDTDCNWSWNVSEQPLFFILNFSHFLCMFTFWRKFCLVISLSGSFSLKDYVLNDKDKAIYEPDSILFKKETKEMRWGWGNLMTNLKWSVLSLCKSCQYTHDDYVVFSFWTILRNDNLLTFMLCKFLVFFFFKIKMAVTRLWTGSDFHYHFSTSFSSFVLYPRT